jgi:hypothetical protein
MGARKWRVFVQTGKKLPAVFDQNTIQHAIDTLGLAADESFWSWLVQHYRLQIWPGNRKDDVSVAFVQQVVLVSRSGRVKCHIDLEVWAIPASECRL